MLRSLIAGLILALAPAVHGQQAVTVDVSDGAVQRFEIAGPARLTYDATTVRIEFGARVQPTPTPTPTPQPPPQPRPVAPGKAYVSLVYDPPAETAAQARMRAELATGGDMAALGATFRAYAISDPAIDRLNLRRQLAPLPCVLVQWLPDGGTTAPVVATIPATSKPAVIDAARKAAGK